MSKVTDPAALEAYRVMNRARYYGAVITPSNCERCGISDSERSIHGHHEDYSRPLDVMWLCDKCHVHRHIELRRERNQQKKRPVAKRTYVVMPRPRPVEPTQKPKTGWAAARFRTGNIKPKPSGTAA